MKNEVNKEVLKLIQENKIILEDYNIAHFQVEEFYKMPKFLFIEPFLKITHKTKIAYALLRDRYALSAKNNFVDKNGSIFIYYKRQELQKLLYVSKPTLSKIFDELRSYKLIREERQYNQAPNKIYLTNVTQILPPNPVDYMWLNNLTTSGKKVLPREVKKFNHSIKSKTYKSKTYKSKINTNINNSQSVCINNGDKLDGQDNKQKKEACLNTPAIDCPIDLNFCNKSITLCVENYNHPLDEQTKDLVHYICTVIESINEVEKTENTGEFLALEPYHVAFVADRITRRAENIKNIRKYIEACLKNVKREYNIYLQNSCKVNPREVFGSKKNTDEDFFRTKFLKELKENDKE